MGNTTNEYLCKDIETLDLSLPLILGVYITADKVTFSGREPTPEEYFEAVRRHLELKKEAIKSKVESDIKMAEIKLLRRN